MRTRVYYDFIGLLYCSMDLYGLIQKKLIPLYGLSDYNFQWQKIAFFENYEEQLIEITGNWYNGVYIPF